MVCNRGAPTIWQDRHNNGTLHCSYCGSIDTAKALQLLTTPGTPYSGSDWKYGWPHKFYLGPYKFYARHLLDATDDQMVLFERIGQQHLQIEYTREMVNGIHTLFYKTLMAPGYQASGVIGGSTGPLGREIIQKP